MTVLATTPGIHEQIFTPRDQRYTIALPATYTGREATPLVLALHYGGPVTPFFGKDILAGLVEPALRELGAIIVAPDCQHGNWTNPHSESEIIALLEHLQAHYPIDAHRTLLTGYSLGGAGTWYLAARNQDRFAAAIPLAGWPQPDSAAVEWKIPLYAIHSRWDEVVPCECTEQMVKQLRDRGVAVELVLLDGISHYEVERFVEPLRAALPWIRRAWGG